jgi:hypothetical protein
MDGLKPIPANPRRSCSVCGTTEVGPGYKTCAPPTRKPPQLELINKPLRGGLRLCRMCTHINHLCVYHPEISRSAFPCAGRCSAAETQKVKKF